MCFCVFFLCSFWTLSCVFFGGEVSLKTSCYWFLFGGMIGTVERLPFLFDSNQHLFISSPQILWKRANKIRKHTRTCITCDVLVKIHCSYQHILKPQRIHVWHVFPHLDVFFSMHTCIQVNICHADPLGTCSTVMFFGEVPMKQAKPPLNGPVREQYPLNDLNGREVLGVLFGQVPEKKLPTL